MLGASVAGYRIEAVAGQGGMGVVYRARQLALDRAVALKLIAPELARDKSFRARFARESRIAASLDHPNVIPVYEAGEDGDRLFIAMRFVDGTDLARMLATEGALDPALAAELVAQASRARRRARARARHRDVKRATVSTATCPPAVYPPTRARAPRRIVPALVRPRPVEGDADTPRRSRSPATTWTRTDVYALGCRAVRGTHGAPVTPRADGECGAHLTSSRRAARGTAEVPLRLAVWRARSEAAEDASRRPARGRRGVARAPPRARRSAPAAAPAPERCVGAAIAPRRPHSGARTPAAVHVAPRRPVRSCRCGAVAAVPCDASPSRSARLSDSRSPARRRRTGPRRLHRRRPTAGRSTARHACSRSASRWSADRGPPCMRGAARRVSRVDAEADAAVRRIPLTAAEGPLATTVPTRRGAARPLQKLLDPSASATTIGGGTSASSQRHWTCSSDPSRSPRCPPRAT